MRSICVHVAVATVLVAACGDDGTPTTGDASMIDSRVIDARMVDARVGPPVQTYIKASNPAVEYGFGGNITGQMRDAIALSSDGSTLAISSVEERSSGVGVDGSETDSGLVRAGAVYIFVRSGSTWMQQAYIKASDTSQEAWFGSAVALSSDGNTLAVGALARGAVYMFTRAGTAWSQQTIVTSTNYDVGDSFGYSVSLSADGALVAVGALGESSASATTPADNSKPRSGAAYIFARSGSTWTQEAYLKASNADAEDRFGNAVDLSADGSTLAVGAIQEASASTNGADNSADSAGAVYVFGRNGTAWTQHAYVKASNPDLGDSFGTTLAISADGMTLAVAADREESRATGINGNQQDDSLISAGAVYVLARSGSQWTQQAYLKASTTPVGVGTGGRFGHSLGISSDGNRVAVGAYVEDAAYVFERSGATWAQTEYLEPSSPLDNDLFGDNIALSADGSTLAAGAPAEDSSAVGVNGDEADNSVSNSGACYVFAL